MNKNIHFIFFGTSELSVVVLDELAEAGYVPAVVVCAEDKPVGRKMIITPPPVKVWAEKNNVKIFQPKTLREEKHTGITEEMKHLTSTPCDLCIVASYGKIIPQAILDIPLHGTLNVHPSLLPKLRGPSPIQSAILSEDQTGVSIMLLDALMDHGPLLAQEKVDIEWPPYADELETLLAHTGGRMLTQVIPKWLSGSIMPTEQDHEHVTLCKKITKEDGLLDLSEPTEINVRKVRAFRGWPHAYFFFTHKEHTTRLIVRTAHIENDEFIIDRVIPEGKKEMNFMDFKKGLK
jgi:methionyl-tRNA formyltransferase